MFNVSRGFLKVLPGNSKKVLMMRFSVVDHVFFKVHPSLDGGKKFVAFLIKSNFCGLFFNPKLCIITSERGY
jgi:hypothetical protein